MTIATRAYLVLVLANVFGGLSYPGQKLALEGLPPATLACLRNLVALIAMGLWLVSRGGVSLRYGPGGWARLAVLGTLAYAAPLLMGIYGTQWSTSANASVLILLEPASILLFSRLLLGEVIRPLQLLGLVAGLGGALCVVLEDHGQLRELVHDEHLWGNLVLVGHGILWGLYSPVMRPLAREHRALDVTFLTMVVAQLVLTPAALGEAHAWRAGPELVPALLWTLALGLAVSFGATILWTWALRHVLASRVAPFVFIQPLVGVLAGHLAFGEVLSRWALAGAALIAVGVVFVVRPGRRPAGFSAG